MDGAGSGSGVKKGKGMATTDESLQRHNNININIRQVSRATGTESNRIASRTEDSFGGVRHLVYDVGISASHIVRSHKEVLRMQAAAFMPRVGFPPLSSWMDTQRHHASIPIHQQYLSYCRMRIVQQYVV